MADEGQARIGEITVLPREWEAGNEAALGPLLERIYPRLNEVAGALCRGERAGSLMQATGLVNEFYVRLLELRYMLGLTAEEAAEAPGVSKATADRELRFARSWLYDRLRAG